MTTVAPPAAQRPHLLALPDQRRVWCTSAAEAVMLWRAITPDSAYARAAARLRPGDTVLDIGANVGLTSLYCLTVQPSVRIVAVEPAPPVYACLERNLAQHARGWDAVRAAVSDRPGRLPLVFYPNATCNSSLVADRSTEDANSRTFLRNSGLDGAALEAVLAPLHDGVRIDVPVTTVAALLAVRPEARIGLLKIDVEGVELDVLRGVAERDWAAIAQLVVEVHDVGGRLATIEALLRHRGYRVSVHRDPTLTGTNLYDVIALAPSLDPDL